MSFNPEQKEIIRKICLSQEGSFLEVAGDYIQKIFKELKDEGYQISISDIAEEVTRKLKQWDEVKKDPDKFLNLLDDQELGMVKHHLVNEYLEDSLARPIWKKLNLFDKANEHRN